MALFNNRRKNGGNGIVDVEFELRELRKRRSTLQARLAEAERAVEEALADRRRLLLETDIDINGADAPKTIVGNLRDEKDAIVDALTSIDVKIADAQARLDQERDRIAREAEAKARTEQADKLAEVIATYQTAAKTLAESFRDTSAVLPQSAHLEMIISRVTSDIMIGCSEALAQVRGYCDSVTTPGAPMLPQSPVIEAPKAKPIERRSVVLLRPSKWNDLDGIRTAGARMVELPLAVAQSALLHGYAIDPATDKARQMMAAGNIEYAAFSVHDATLVDLEKPLLPAPVAPHIQPVVHSVVSEMKTGGFATIGPTR